MAFPSSLPQFYIAVIHIANLANRGIAVLPDQAYFTRGQADLGVIALFGEQLGGSAR
jgi:hypothetical protein